MDKITELPSITYNPDEQALLAAQRMAIFGYDQSIGIHSNRIVQDVSMFSRICYVPNEWIVKKCDMGEWPAAVIVSSGEFDRIQGDIRDTDRPGIAAMSAKNAAPAPESVLSIGGEQVSEREITEALRAYRAKHAPAVKETPRGLMTVRALDHRLGLWSGEGC